MRTEYIISIGGGIPNDAGVMDADMLQVGRTQSLYLVIVDKVIVGVEGRKRYLV